MVGEVSVGIRESSVVAARCGTSCRRTRCGSRSRSASAALASWALARRLQAPHVRPGTGRDRPLLQEREATLHGIREGVIAFDRTGPDQRRQRRGATAAAAARRQRSAAGSTTWCPPGRCATCSPAAAAGSDDIVLTDDFCLVINRMPVTLRGRPHGAVVTLRDRTEMAGLLRELDGERSLTESLRAQQHEFANRMHAVAGLLELGRAGRGAELPHRDPGHRGRVRRHAARAHRRAADRRAAARQGRRGERARHRARDLRPRPGSATRRGSVQALTTILGNLIDNAFDASRRRTGAAAGAASRSSRSRRGSPSR